MKISSIGLSIVVSIVLFCSNITNAQFDDYSTKIGIQLNGLLPDTEFDKDLKVPGADFKFSYLGRVFLRFELIKQFIETEVGVGYGTLAGVDFTNSEYKTEIIPIDLRLILSPFKIEAFNPYAFGGVGMLHYSVKTKPVSISKNITDLKETDWSMIVPIGGGLEINLSDNLNLDISGGYTFAFTDNLNYYNNQDVLGGGKTGYHDGYLNGSLGLTFVGGSGNTDKDGDGLIKKYEKEIGTDPDIPDTDSDGLKDGDEVNLYKSDPTKTDTDDDGLSDGDEVLKYKSDPTKTDTDGDGLSDGDEVLKYKADPTKADSDQDGLNDYEEIFTYKTDPLKPDTDGEGLNDGDEVQKYKTDPLKTDTDGDGLYDGEEVLKYKTDPLKKDTDAGSVDDLTEVQRGTNPLDPSDDVIKIGVPIVLEGVTFESNKADITPESSQILRSSLKTLTTYPEIQIEIGGHTDNVGSKNSNIKLSQKRADAVRNWLIERGIDSGRIIAKGYGPDFPIVSNDSPENKRKNRRIEFKRIK